MKHVWILNHYAQEPGGPGGTRHFGLAKHLRDYGWDASIIAASTELNTNRQRLSEHESSRKEYFEDVRFLWLKTQPYQGNGLDRIKNMFQYAIKAIAVNLKAKLPSPDIIIGSSVHPLAAVAGLILARRYSVPFIFEVRDLWPETLIALGRIRKGGLQDRLLGYIEKLLYKKAEKIITLLPGVVHYVEKLGVDGKKVVWIPNGIDVTQFKDYPYSENKTTFTLMYFGAHGTANGLENLLEAINVLNDNPHKIKIHLRLIGDGPFKETLMKKSIELGVSESVSFEDPVSKDQIPELASQADAFVFNLVDAPVFQYGISSNKLFDFMASARPTIFCCNALNNPVEDAGSGITVQPENPAALAKAIEELSLRPYQERLEMGYNGRKYVFENHGFDRLAKRLAGVLDELST